MEYALSPPDLANAVTSFCTLGAGLTTLLLCRWVRPQPPRWVFAYFTIFVTGIPTLGWHGWPTPTWQVLDIGSNLVVAWALQLAVLGDHYAPRTRRNVAIASGAVNLLAIGFMLHQAVKGTLGEAAIRLGSDGEFLVGEAVLVADAIGVVALIFARRRHIPDAARPLLYLVTGLFLFGAVLATQKGDVVDFRVGSWHALWHIVGMFGFIFFWAFNHVRFELDAAVSGRLAGAREGAREARREAA